MAHGSHETVVFFAADIEGYGLKLPLPGVEISAAARSLALTLGMMQ